MAFCDNLQYLRRRDGITQEELAEKLGVSRQSVSKWETGDAYPETEKIIALCRMFGVSMDDLMLGDVSALKESAPCGEEKCGGTLQGNEASDGQTERAEEDCAFYVTPEEAEKVEKLTDLPDRAQKAAKRMIISHAVSSALFACTVVTFFCLGAILNLWHPAWLLFPLCFAVCSFTEILFSCKKDGTTAPLGKRVLKAFSSSVWLFAVTVYLFIGIVYSLWHPGWIIFVVCAFLTPLAETLATCFYGRNNKKDKGVSD